MGDKGYTRLPRSVWDDAFLFPKGHVFSKAEAWLYLLNHEASGVDTEDLKRGEFRVSRRRLALKFGWSDSCVHRFLNTLVNKNLIEKVNHQSNHQSNHLRVCNYGVYGGSRTTDRTSNRTTHILKKGERRIKSVPSEHMSFERPDPTDPKVLWWIYRQYNQVLPALKTFAPKREARCRSRINRALERGRLEPYLQDFAQAVQKAQLSRFLRGEVSNWKASFDWLLEEDNIAKVLEGNYDDRSPAQPGRDNVRRWLEGKEGAA